MLELISRKPRWDLFNIVPLFVSGNFLLEVDLFAEDCLNIWLDRDLNQSQVDDLVKKLTKTPTQAKSHQPWLGIVDLPKEKIVSKSTLKGARITVIGGRHRQAAYKKVKYRK